MARTRTTRPARAFLCCVAIAATAVACTTAPSPASPQLGRFGVAASGPNGETLKIAAPTLQSPIAGVQLRTTVVVLTFAAVIGTYIPFVPGYQIELRNPSGALIVSPTVATTTYTVVAPLARNTTYTWRVRATFQGAYGPWSASDSFKTTN